MKKCKCWKGGIIASEINKYRKHIKSNLIFFMSCFNDDLYALLKVNLKDTLHIRTAQGLDMIEKYFDNLEKFARKQDREYKELTTPVDKEAGK